MNELEMLDNNSLKGALEALLLVSSDPVPAAAFARILNVTPSEASEALVDLSREYREGERGIQLREVAGGWRLSTHPGYAQYIEEYVLSWDTRKLSQAALETLAVVAYHQPVTREGVKAIRGVNSEGVISSLIEKGLIKEAGRDRDRGQAILYGTTHAFLERFGLKSLKDLPDLEQFAPDEKAKQFIRERLSGRSINASMEDQLGVDDREEDVVSDNTPSHIEHNKVQETANVVLAMDLEFDLDDDSSMDDDMLDFVFGTSEDE